MSEGVVMLAIAYIAYLFYTLTKREDMIRKMHEVICGVASGEVTVRIDDNGIIHFKETD